VCSWRGRWVPLCSSHGHYRTAAVLTGVFSAGTHTGARRKSLRRSRRSPRRRPTARGACMARRYHPRVVEKLAVSASPLPPSSLARPQRRHRRRCNPSRNVKRQSQRMG
jgi:hypothetical protein